jgi:replication factor C small subunit
MVNLIEKYRPMTLDDVYGQKFIVNKLRAYIKNIINGNGDGDFPHMLFSGPPGTGKTSVVYSMLNDTFGKDYRQNLLEKNASNVLMKDLREEIIDFAEKMPIGHFKGSDGSLYDIPFNVIFLDEVDRLSKDSQQILRRVMETCASDTRFILSCNYPNKLIDAIKSRCTRFYFKPLSEESLISLMIKIADGERWEATPDALSLIAKNVNGDARTAIATLELGAKTGPVDEEEVRRCIPIALEHFNTNLLRMAILAKNKSPEDYSKDFKMIESQLSRLFYEDGKSSQQILISIFESVDSDNEMPVNIKRKILENMAEINRDIHMVDDPLFAIKCWLRGLKL